ncbi:MAG: MATE family efflux transporter [Treponema sp.]|jgi:putative MATE family efflux protein|nr:MATE family efflux transporter [Treponema sp.]
MNSAANASTNFPPRNKMGTEPVGRLLITMSLPIMFSMIIEALYNVVDSMFVSRLSENALTAVSLAFPMHMLLISVTIGTSVGISACLSRKLGAGDQKGVAGAAGNGLFLALMSYAVFLVFAIFLTKPYFASQTQDAEIYQMGVEYLFICMAFSFGSILQITFQRILQATGRTTLSMVSQLAGAAFNIIFDPLLIFGLLGFPRMGVRGAAIATVGGQFLGLCLAAFFNFTKNKEVHFSFRGLKPEKHIIGTIYRVGAPAIVNQGLNSLMAFGVNFILIGISSTAVAAFGIYIKIQNFIFLPVYGLNNGVIAITAFNYGSREKKRIQASMKFGMIYAISMMLTGTIVLQLLARPIFSLFGTSLELMNAGVGIMRVISLGFVIVAFLFISQGIFQALGNGLYSLIVALLQVVVILLPLLYIFAKVFELRFIWWAFIAAQSIAAVAAAFLLKNIYSQKVKPLE